MRHAGILVLGLAATLAGCRSEVYRQTPDGRRYVGRVDSAQAPIAGRGRSVTAGRSSVLIDAGRGAIRVDEDDADEILGEAYESASSAASAEQALFEAAEREFEARRLRAAFQRYVVLLERFPRSSNFAFCLERIYDTGRLFIEAGSEDRSIEALFGESDEEYGVRVLDFFATNFDRHPRADDALLLIAEQTVRDSRYDEAIAVYTRLIDEYPESDLVPRAELRIAQARIRINGDVERDKVPLREALAGLRLYIQRYPNGDEIQLARSEAARVAEMLAGHNLAVARRYRRYSEPGGFEIYLRHILDEYPRTEAAKTARELLDDYEENGTESWSFWDRFTL